MGAVPAPGGASMPGWRVSGANTAGFWVGGERSSLGGVKDHERSEYRTGDLLLWEQGVARIRQ